MSSGRSPSGRGGSRGGEYLEIDASHSPNVTAPEALATLLDKLAG